jgi:hypothetical protein
MFPGSLGGDVRLYDLLAQCLSSEWLGVLVFIACSAAVVAACSMIRYLAYGDASALCRSPRRTSNGKATVRPTGQ